MRTTVEIPSELLREAKARAALQGESLKSLLTRAVATEIHKKMKDPAGHRKRQEFPVFGNPQGTPVDLTNEDIARALSDEDLARRAFPKSKKQR